MINCLGVYHLNSIKEILKRKTMKGILNLNNLKIGRRLTYSYVIIFTFFIIIGGLFTEAIKSTKETAELEYKIQAIETSMRDAMRLHAMYSIKPNPARKKAVFRYGNVSLKSAKEIQRAMKMSPTVVDTVISHLDTLVITTDQYFANRLEYDSLLVVCINLTDSLKSLIEKPIDSGDHRTEHRLTAAGYRYLSLVNNALEKYKQYKEVSGKGGESYQTNLIKRLNGMTLDRSTYFFIQTAQQGHQFQNLLMELAEANGLFVYSSSTNRQLTLDYEVHIKNVIFSLRRASAKLKYLNDLKLRNTIIQVGAVVLFIILFIALMAYATTKSITFGIKETMRVAKEISQGHLNVQIQQSLLIRKDEIGTMSKAFQQMTQTLSTSIANVISGIEFMSSASSQLTKSSDQLSTGATNQAASVEEISSTVEQMVANIEQNSTNAVKTQQMADLSITKVKAASESTISAARTSEVISEKVTLVNEIAKQTNILALNAAVEAARAGQAGRGFAVVANEVRKLADRSKEAAGEIGELSLQGVKSSQLGEDGLQLTIPQIEQTGNLIEEISAASKEQSLGAEQINSALVSLNGLTQENASQAEEIAASAGELKEQAEVLNKAVKWFKM